MIVIAKKIWQWITGRRPSGPAPRPRRAMPACVACEGGWTRTRPPNAPGWMRCPVCAGTAVMPAKVRRAGLDLYYGLYFWQN